MTQTLSPNDTGEIRLAESPTQPLDPFRLRRAEAMPNSVVDTLPRTIGLIPPLTQPDTMPTPPRPPQKAPVPMLRPATPELYADSRARRGLPPLARKPRGYVGAHRKASR